MSEKRIVVAIDGPAGVGKSTLAKRIADKLGFLYINTGSMYRAVALWALRLNIDARDTHKIEQLAKEAQISLEAADGQVLLNGEDVTQAIQEMQVANLASQISGIAGVRRALLPLQRAMAERNHVVMEGRDIGSVVFPEAQVKIFLDAEPGERARRRALQLGESGSGPDLTAVAGELQLRDERDRGRAESPMVQAPDADLVDTTGLTLEEVEDAVLLIVRSRTSNGRSSRD